MKSNCLAGFFGAKSDAVSIFSIIPQSAYASPNDFPPGRSIESSRLPRAPQDETQSAAKQAEGHACVAVAGGERRHQRRNRVISEIRSTRTSTRAAEEITDGSFSVVTATKHNGIARAARRRYGFASDRTRRRRRPRRIEIAPAVAGGRRIVRTAEEGKVLGLERERESWD